MTAAVGHKKLTLKLKLSLEPCPTWSRTRSGIYTCAHTHIYIYIHSMDSYSMIAGCLYPAQFSAIFSTCTMFYVFRIKLYNI